MTQTKNGDEGLEKAADPTFRRRHSERRPRRSGAGRGADRTLRSPRGVRLQRFRIPVWALPVIALLLVLAGPVACGPVADGGDAPSDTGAEGTASDGAADDASTLTVYSGRSERLMGPVFERFEEASGIELEVRYGDTPELAATLLEEGDATPADIFVSQDAAALGAVAAAGLLRSVPAELVARVPPRFTGGGTNPSWVGLSGRARTIVYNVEALGPDDLPRSLEDVTDPRWRGRFGVAPVNGSFQAHLAVHRVVAGAEASDELLAGLAANEPQRYANNRAIVDAVASGEVDFGLTNHYYLWRLLQENPRAPAKNFFPDAGPAASFVNVAGAGLLSDAPEAIELLDYLLSEDAQRYFADETFEYPLIDGVEPGGGLVPLEELDTPDVDFGRVSAVLEETVRAIDASGLMR